MGADGPTHHGMFDIAYMRMIPHMRVIAPSNEVELVSALHTALELGGPVAVRYPRSSVQGLELPDQPEIMPYGKGDIRRDGEDIAILAFGSMVQTALKAADLLAEQGVDARVVDMRWAKPIDHDAVEHAAQTKLVVTLEDGVKCGGAGEGVLDMLARIGATKIGRAHV